MSDVRSYSASAVLLMTSVTVYVAAATFCAPANNPRLTQCSLEVAIYAAPAAFRASAN